MGRPILSKASPRNRYASTDLGDCFTASVRYRIATGNSFLSIKSLALEINEFAGILVKALRDEDGCASKLSAGAGHDRTMTTTANTGFRLEQKKERNFARFEKLFFVNRKALIAIP
ncbi:MAG: hypothetical protein M0T73_01835 [Deltaproteobacteria bacterium]|nr:hypothetical protein [Deltaproteobacteria bacterium]